jgi:hypothetical protein
MRATFIPSFFPKPPASTLAVSCKHLFYSGRLAAHSPTPTSEKTISTPATSGAARQDGPAVRGARKCRTHSRG